MYEANPAHKRHPSRWNAPGLRTGKSICPDDISPVVAECVLAAGIQKSIDTGLCRFRGDETAPYLVWGCSTFTGKDGSQRDIVWEARITNPGAPTWHAYPITRDRHDSEMSKSIRNLLWH